MLACFRLCAHFGRLNVLDCICAIALLGKFALRHAACVRWLNVCEARAACIQGRSTRKGPMSAPATIAHFGTRTHLEIHGNGVVGRLKVSGLS
jgi:hypothetical protein